MKKLAVAFIVLSCLFTQTQIYSAPVNFLSVSLPGVESGSNSNIALQLKSDDNTPTMLYKKSGSLYYATYNLTTNTLTETNLGIGGVWWFDMTLDSQNRPHIAYQTVTGYTTGNVYYTYNNGTSWANPQLIYQQSSSQSNVNQGVNITVDQNNNPAISYAFTFGLSGTIMYSKYNGSSWVNGSVVYATNQPLQNDIIMDALGNVHVPYYQLNPTTM